jgi:hypothetical protein
LASTIDEIFLGKSYFKRFGRIFLPARFRGALPLRCATGYRLNGEIKHGGSHLRRQVAGRTVKRAGRPRRGFRFCPVSSFVHRYFCAQLQKLASAFPPEPVSSRPAKIGGAFAEFERAKLKQRTKAGFDTVLRSI